MKPFKNALSFIILFAFLLAPIVHFAQEAVDIHHPEPIKGSWYADQKTYLDGMNRNVDPFIAAVIDQINPDSLYATVLHLQNYVSRFMLLDNRLEIANWLMSKFVSYGYQNVKLDSFYVLMNGGDTLWQYNVICTATGSSAPDEIYVIGGHYDSITTDDPMTFAPGANDNGSAVAATLEVARVMKLMNVQPEATIQFTLFAAEELGLFGSWYQAHKSWEEGIDLRYVLNLDMVSNDPDSGMVIKLYNYPYSEWATQLTADVTERYTDLSVYFPDWMGTSSDSYPYYAFGFPVTYFEERDFSPNWHKNSDIIDSCNFTYLTEVARASCAVLMEQQFLPYPVGLWANSSEEGVTLTWSKSDNDLIAGYNVYRSEQSGSGFGKINTALVTDTTYLDNSIAVGQDFYYRITTVNDSLDESWPSSEIWGSRFAFTDSLLVVSYMKGSMTLADSIREFYAAILDSIPFHWVDVNQEQQLPLSELAQHHHVLWLMNSLDYHIPLDTTLINMINFFDNGGNLMVSGFLPSRLLAYNTTYPFKFSEQYFINRYFKVDSVNRKINSFMFRAYPVKDNFDTLDVDPHKWMEPSYPGEIYNIEVFTPAPGADVIYRFDSHYSPGTSQGMMKDKAVGLEYMGEDFKTILLSFPLYYLDTSDARGLMNYVMKYKFNDPTGIPPGKQIPGVAWLQNHPNPFTDRTTISFILEKPADVNVSVYNMQGALVSTMLDKHLTKGFYSIDFSGADLSGGIYQLVLKTDKSIFTRKMIKVK